MTLCGVCDARLTAAERAQKVRRCKACRRAGLQIPKVVRTVQRKPSIASTLTVSRPASERLAPRVSWWTLPMSRSEFMQRAAQEF
jgi:hypothetical protein